MPRTGPIDEILQRRRVKKGLNVYCGLFRDVSKRPFVDVLPPITPFCLWSVSAVQSTFRGHESLCANSKLVGDRSN
ncbi:hypothetical protein DPMN_054221 [Dreissena polymorpha]|uniref:Uncharacterized protein n=1 Tax=Dreissena polymorpha TaxID=45954 RepID=A0A9D4CNI4_DREPO|nr:hypothetical protein DPMN_054221 [Dreissena polymorpha]